MLFSLPLFCTIPEKESLVCEPEKITQSFTHFDLGLGPLPFCIPTFSLGHRNQWDHHGLDLSLRFSTMLVASQMTGTASYLYYFRPDLKSQLYFGSGLGFNELFMFDKHASFCVSPEFTFGKEYLNKNGKKRIIQVQLGLASYEKYFVPWMVLSFGFGFESKKAPSKAQCRS